MAYKMGKILLVKRQKLLKVGSSKIYMFFDIFQMRSENFGLLVISDTTLSECATD